MKNLSLASLRMAALIMILALAAPFYAAAEAPARFNVATYNIRQKNHADSLEGNGWGSRYKILAQLVRFHEFDIFGTQEGFSDQLADLLSVLPGYAYIGVGREDGRRAGEHSAIFYRTDLFDVVDHGDFWLSQQPQQPSIGWDAVLPRICTWGRFRHKESGREFLFFNLHADHVGKQARIQSAYLVMDMMQKLAPDGIPVFLTGDFNVDQTHQSYATFTSGQLRDSFTIADLVYALNGTFNSYHTDDFTTSRIDHIFVSPQVVVEKYGVLTDTYRTLDDADAQPKESVKVDAPEEITLHSYKARTPSDHFPVLIRVALP